MPFLLLKKPSLASHQIAEVYTVACELNSSDKSVPSELYKVFKI